MKETWYHVWEYPKCWGFAAENGIVTKHPDWRFKGMTLEEIKPHLKNCKVYEIKEQNKEDAQAVSPD